MVNILVLLNYVLCWELTYAANYPEILASFPCMVQIANRNGSHLCGGALLQRIAVLSSAECLQDYFLRKKLNALVVQAGYPGSPTYQEKSVRIIHIHNRYSFDNETNELAVVILASEIKNTLHSRPIQFPPRPPTIGENCFYPTYDLIPKRFPYNISFLPMVITKRNLCKKPELYNKICVNSRKAAFGTCKGDNGGPLICKNLLYGLSYKTIEICKELPELFTEIYPHREWIRRMILISIQQTRNVSMGRSLEIVLNVTFSGGYILSIIVTVFMRLL